MNLPEAFCRRMQEMLGKDEYEEFRKAYEQERVPGLRINPLKKKENSTEFLNRRFSLKPVPWCRNGYFYKEEERPGKTCLHEAGAFYIQEPSAMSAAELLFFDRPAYAEDGGPAEKILDLCAAPGGKSTQIAGRMMGKGLLWSNEYVPNRAKILSQNIERMGVVNAIVSNEDTAHLAEKLPGFFDRVLVDAPCSGEGMFRKTEEAGEEWSEENVQLCAVRQLEILRNADRMLKPGGILVYSTCTFAPQEDEQTIENFRAETAEEDGSFTYEIVDTVKEAQEKGLVSPAAFFSAGRPEWGKQQDPDLKFTCRLFPHLIAGEGHYAAVLRKKGSCSEETTALDSKKRKDRKTEKNGKFPGKEEETFYRNFLQETFTGEAAGKLLPENFRERFFTFGDQWYLLPEGAPDLKGLKVLRAGLHLGTECRNRFEPSHALALASGAGDVLRTADLPEADERAENFARGESFPFEGERGWTLVLVDGYSLGWGKSDGRTMKNHYPKGLRILGGR